MFAHHKIVFAWGRVEGGGPHQQRGYDEEKTCNADAFQRAHPVQELNLSELHLIDVLMEALKLTALLQEVRTDVC